MLAQHIFITCQHFDFPVQRGAQIHVKKSKIVLIHQNIHFYEKRNHQAFQAFSYQQKNVFCCVFIKYGNHIQRTSLKYNRACKAIEPGYRRSIQQQSNLCQKRLSQWWKLWGINYNSVAGCIK